MTQFNDRILFKPVIGKGILQFSKNSSSAFGTKVLKMMKWLQPFLQFNLFESLRACASSNKATKITHILWLHTLYCMLARCNITNDTK